MKLQVNSPACFLRPLLHSQTRSQHGTGPSEAHDAQPSLVAVHTMVSLLHLCDASTGIVKKALQFPSNPADACLYLDDATHPTASPSVTLYVLLVSGAVYCFRFHPHTLELLHPEFQASSIARPLVNALASSASSDTRQKRRLPPDASGLAQSAKKPSLDAHTDAPSTSILDPNDLFLSSDILRPAAASPAPAPILTAAEDAARHASTSLRHIVALPQFKLGQAVDDLSFRPQSFRLDPDTSTLVACSLKTTPDALAHRIDFWDVSARTCLGTHTFSRVTPTGAPVSTPSPFLQLVRPHAHTSRAPSTQQSVWTVSEPLFSWLHSGSLSRSYASPELLLLFSDGLPAGRLEVLALPRRYSRDIDVNTAYEHREPISHLLCLGAEHAALSSFAVVGHFGKVAVLTASGTTKRVRTHETHLASALTPLVATCAISDSELLVYNGRTTWAQPFRSSPSADPASASNGCDPLWSLDPPMQVAFPSSAAPSGRFVCLAASLQLVCGVSAHGWLLSALLPSSETPQASSAHEDPVPKGHLATQRQRVGALLHELTQISAIQDAKQEHHDRLDAFVARLGLAMRLMGLLAQERRRAMDARFALLQHAFAPATKYSLCFQPSAEREKGVALTAKLVRARVDALAATVLTVSPLGFDARGTVFVELEISNNTALDIGSDWSVTIQLAHPRTGVARHPHNHTYYFSRPLSSGIPKKSSRTLLVPLRALLGPTGLRASEVSSADFSPINGQSPLPSVDAVVPWTLLPFSLDIGLLHTSSGFPVAKHGPHTERRPPFFAQVGFPLCRWIVDAALWLSMELDCLVPGAALPSAASTVSPPRAAALSSLGLRFPRTLVDNAPNSAVLGKLLSSLALGDASKAASGQLGQLAFFLRDSSAYLLLAVSPASAKNRQRTVSSSMANMAADSREESRDVLLTISCFPSSGETAGGERGPSESWCLLVTACVRSALLQRLTQQAVVRSEEAAHSMRKLCLAHPLSFRLPRDAFPSSLGLAPVKCDAQHRDASASADSIGRGLSSAAPDAGLMSTAAKRFGLLQKGSASTVLVSPHGFARARELAAELGLLGTGAATAGLPQLVRVYREMRGGSE